MVQTYICVVYMYRGHRKIMGVILHCSLDYYLETGLPHPNSPHIITSPLLLHNTHLCWVMSVLLYVSARNLNSNPHVCAAPCWDFNKDCDPHFPIILLLTVILVSHLPRVMSDTVSFDSFYSSTSVTIL